MYAKSSSQLRLGANVNNSATIAIVTHLHTRAPHTREKRVAQRKDSRWSNASLSNAGCLVYE